jgi:hypothetical protein
MYIPIAGFAFQGPLTSIDDLDEKPGVFTIICEEKGTYYLLDVDHGENVREAVSTHERKDSWEELKRGEIRYAVLYADEFPNLGLPTIEEAIRKEYPDIPCKETA